MDRQDVVLGALVSLGGLALTRAALELPAGTVNDPLGPRGLPLLLGIGFAVSGAVLAATALGAAPRGTDSTEVSADDARAPYSWRRVSGAVAASIAYVLVFVPLGALLATIGYAIALLRLQGRTTRREVAAVAIAFPLGVYLLFDVVLSVPLPAGLLEPLFRLLRL